MEPMSLLQVNGLAKKYGRRQVVNNVSFEVDGGEIVGLLGPNGAGKTTSFRMTCGMITPDSGQVILDSKDVTDWPMHLRAKDGGLGYLPQQSSVFARLTVEQNLTATMQLLGFSARQRKEETERLIEEFGLQKFRNTNSAQVSGGERRRLEIARCLISKPKVIMLDEPFAGIDPVTVQSIQAIIQRLAQSGIGILITDHAAREILQITGRTYVIHEGKVLCSGTAEEVANHPEVRKNYLGAIESIIPLRNTHAGLQSNPGSSRHHAPHSGGSHSGGSHSGDSPLGEPFSERPSEDQHATFDSHLPGTDFQTTNFQTTDFHPSDFPVAGPAPSSTPQTPARGTQVPHPKFRQSYFQQPKTLRDSQ